MISSCWTLSSVNEDKHPVVKRLLIQTLTKGLFNEAFIKDAFETFPHIIAQLSDTLLVLLNALQKSKRHEINELSSTCFRQLFAVESSCKKEIVGALVQFLCEKTPNLPFTSKSDFKMMTLNILGELAKCQPTAEALLMNHRILLRVLDVSKVKSASTSID